MSTVQEGGRIIVPVRLPAEHYRKVAIAAEGFGVNAHTLIEKLVEKAVAGRPDVVRARKPHAGRKTTLEDHRAEVERMFHAGFSDQQIGDALGFKAGTIATFRSSVGLVKFRRRMS